MSSDLNPDDLRSRVARLRRFGTIHYAQRVDSTNAAALALLDEKAMLGCTIVTDMQVAGRGRAGRSWISPPGSSVTMSTIMPDDLPNNVLPALGYWTGLCVADAIARTCNVRTALKWPNDVLIGAAKVCGILIEGRTLGALTRTVVGVGINANRPAAMPFELEGRAAWLSDAVGHPVQRADLIVALLTSYENHYDRLRGHPRDVIHEWAQRAAVAGKRLRVNSAKGELLHEGIARGLSDDGALLLETQDGPVTVRLGDVSALQA